MTKEVFEYVKGTLKGAGDLHQKRSVRLTSLLVKSYADDQVDTQMWDFLTPLFFKFILLYNQGILLNRLFIVLYFWV